MPWYDCSDTIFKMKVAVSLPDPLFQAAEHLARRLKKPRSRLYAEAIAEYVGTHGSVAITERLDEIYGAESSVLDEALQIAQTKTLSHEAW